MKKLIFIALIQIIIILSGSGIGEAGPSFTLIYVVQQGDALYNIARDYDISLEQLLQANDLSKNSSIRVGDEIIIPLEEEERRPKFEYTLSRSGSHLRERVNLETGNNYSVRINKNNELPEVDIPENQIITYHIKSGDTLYDLARDFNTSTGVIMALNNMENSIIRSGETIRIPINNLNPRQVLARLITQKELELIARVIHGEARGEPYIGQVAVGAVIINRIMDPFFPDSVSQVIYQSRQFSAVEDGQFNLAPNRTAYRAAREALNGIDPSRGALYFYNPRTASNLDWFNNRPRIVTIGNHVFTK